MRTRGAEFGVGIFIILTIAAIFFLALRVSGLLSEIDKGGYTVTAHFQNIGGLTPRAKVTLSGVVIGRVTNIALDPKRLDAVVTMQINNSMKEISTDSTASILTEGLIGGQYIGISVGADDTMLKEGSEIEQTQSALVLEDLISKFLFSKATEPTPGATGAASAPAATAKAATSDAF
ncbi:outer membrane lipid asymmetry maintenance protein MlaD [Aquirhabdus parva]|uniref:Outer membrane lipid asymmetry maintenance protein MlaD n=1 Tax=Aquirhabdus parva TaxID=2283318 RepID=A0A345P8H4_9GAMM|nr:outer membrane lipid asymmetry maintenance protein MlaD [Aquirhabdus parva]